MKFAYAQPSKIAGRSCTHGACAPGRMPKCGERRDAQEPPSVHGGFTLLEVLIAIVVLSIGLLGLAGLQAAGLRNNTSAYMRTIATQQIYDMTDRMRTNPAGVAAAGYDALTGIPTSSNADCLTVTGCTPADMATHDAFEWNTANKNLLPLGAGSVTRVAGTNKFTISVLWDDNRTGVAKTTFSMTFQP